MRSGYIVGGPFRNSCTKLPNYIVIAIISLSCIGILYIAVIGLLVARYLWRIVSQRLEKININKVRM